MSRTFAESLEPPTILSMFNNEMKKRLINQALESMRPAVEANAEQILLDIKPVVQKHLDIMTGDVLFQLKMVNPNVS